MQTGSSKELRLGLADGQECALCLWGDPQSPPVLALHGWQDNAASFALLAPLLAANRCIVAPDLPGHGRSSPRPQQVPYYIWSYVREVRAIVEHFGWSRFDLLGHSMGGAVACLYSALYPRELGRLILLDSVGPLATPAQQLPAQMREALAEMESLKARQRNYYRNRDAAIQARADKGVTREAATKLAERGVLCDDKGCYWNLDPRLRVLNPLSLCEEQVEAFIRQISCPQLLVLAPAFWHTPARQAMLARRLSYFPHAELHRLQGGHHQHMEAETPQVAALIERFLAA